MTHSPLISFMLRVGTVKVNNWGLFVLRPFRSRDRKTKWKDWVCPFTGTLEHKRQIRKNA